MSSGIVDLEAAETGSSAQGPVAPSLQPKPHTKASGLWRWFKRDTSKGATNPTADCFKCDAQPFRVKGNAMLIKHLSSCTGISADERAEARAIATQEGLNYEGKADHQQSHGDSQPSSSQAAGSKKRRTASGSLHAHFESQKLNAEQIKAINRALLLFFVMCGVSFSAVASPWFLYFVQLLRPLYKPPGKDTLSGRLLASEAEAVFSEYVPREDLLLAQIYPLDDPACCKIFAPQSNDALAQAPAQAPAAKYEGPEIDIHDYLAGVDESSLS